MKHYLLYLFCLALGGCTVDPCTHCDLADKLTASYITKAKFCDGLDACGYGGAMMGDIRKINIHFDTNQCLQKAAMRKLIVRKAEELIQAMNQDKELRPYLHDYPCGIRNIELSISYHKNKNSTYPHVRNAQIFRGLVLYSTFEKSEDWFITETDETWEEAVENVHGGQAYMGE